jgi:hypothetical protein
VTARGTAQVPPTYPCRWCPNEVVDDGEGNWVHVGSIGCTCRNDANVSLPTTAEPQLTPPPPRLRTVDWPPEDQGPAR